MVGIITGVVFAHLLKVLAISQSGEFKIVAEILAIPAFWFGGPWIATKMLSEIDWNTQLPAYCMTLTLVFIVVSGFPLLSFIRLSSKEISKIGS